MSCMRHRSRVAPVIALVLAAVLVASCGSDDAGDTAPSTGTGRDGGSATTDEGGGEEGEGTTIDVDVEEDGFRFVEERIEAPAGEITLRSKNPQDTMHNIGVRDDSGVLGEGDLVSDGETSEVTVQLEPGEYIYFCTPHESVSMTGTLVVT